MCPSRVEVTKFWRTGSTSQQTAFVSQIAATEQSGLVSIVLIMAKPGSPGVEGGNNAGRFVQDTASAHGCWRFKGSFLSPLLIKICRSRYPHFQEKRERGRNAASGWTQGTDNQLELRGNFRFWSISNHFDPRYNLKCSCLGYYSPRACWVVFTPSPACSLSLLIRSREEFNEKWVCGWRGQWRVVLDPLKKSGRVWLCCFKQEFSHWRRFVGREKHLSFCQFFWLPAPALFFMESWIHWII